MKKIIKLLTIGVLSFSSIQSVNAKDDTDIYFPDESVSTSQNVLFVMDVSGSMSREVGNTGVNRFQAMKAAFNNILTTVPPSLNVGLMNFGSIGSDRHNYAQGVKFPVSPLTANARSIIENGLPLNNDGSVNWNANNMPEPDVTLTVFDYLPNIVDSWSPRGWTPLVDSLYEAALYFRGEQVAWGLGPLEQEGNEWVAHPSTYTGVPGGWDATACTTTWTERLPQGVIPAEYRCPSDPSNPVSPGTYANCAATKTDCIAVTGGGGGDSSTVTSSTSNNIDTTLSLDGTWSNTDSRSVSAGTNQEYTFTVTQRDSIYIKGTAASSIFPYIYLLDDQGNLLEEEDRWGYYYSAITRTLDPGTYTVRVGTYYSRESGNFTLEVSGYVDSLKNSTGYADYNIGGSWSNSGGRDATSANNPQYYFTVTDPGEVSITLNALYASNPNADAYLYLLDDQGNILEEDDNSYHTVDSQIVRTLNAGTYQIVAGTYNSGTSGDFEIYLMGNIGVFPYSGSISTSNYPEARYIKFKTLSAFDSDAWAAVAELSLVDAADQALDKTAWSLVSVDSEETDAVSRPATNAFDNDNNTFWHTQWYLSAPVHPHEVIIDLGGSHNLKEFKYLARQDGNDNGRVNAYEVYLSTDGSSWGSAAIADNFADVATEQSATFPITTSTVSNITVGNTATGAGSSGYTFTHTLESGSNRTVVAGVAIEDSDVVASATDITVTYGGVAMTAIIDSLATIDTSYAMSTQLFYLNEANLPTDGEKTVQVNHIGGGDISAGVMTLKDVDQSGPEATATNSRNGNGAISTDISTLSENALLVDIVGGGHSQSSGYFNNDVSQTSKWVSNASSSQSESSIYQTTTAASYTMGWSWQNDGSNINRSTHSVTAFVPASASGSGSGSGSGGTDTKVTICHVPPGNPDNAHTITISRSALAAHQAHGDLIGACGTGISSEGTTEGSCLYTMCSGATVPEPTYTSPIKSACQSNAIILLSDGSPQAGNAVTVNATYDKVVTNNQWTGGLADAFRNLTCEDSPEGFPRGKCGAELTNYLANNDNSSVFEGDQTVQTYTVGLSLGQGSAAENYLRSLSTVDDPNTVGVEGYYSATDQSTLITAFNEILTELELNTTTTAFSNPGYSIVAKTGLNHEDSVFIPTFEVRNNTVWKGNLKKYKIVNSGGKRQIRGKNNQNAVTELGAFSVGALDFWSASDTPDGTDVAKGGAASLLDPSSRNLYSDLVCSVGADCDLTNSNNHLSIDNVSTSNANGNALDNGLTNADFGGVDETASDRKKYTCFIRGYVDFDPATNVCTGDARKHMGDMLHFEPIVVTYDKNHDDRDDSTHKQVIIVGTNEGYLHAFDTDSGEEIFAFMPRELLKNIKPQYEDNEYRGHKYGVDGVANVWVNDIDHDGVIESAQGEHVYLYFGLRRGGNDYYALDITNPTSPKLKWKIEGGGNGNFQYLGETWSRPYLARIHTAKNDATLKEVLIFTGGYDSTNQDKPLAEREATDSVGTDVFIVDADTGEFIWSIKKGTPAGNAITGSTGLTHSIPGGVRILDMNKDGAIDRMYFADVVGNVWRLELDADLYDEEDSDSKFDLDDSKLIKLASLGGATTGVEPRKFFNEPDVSLTRKGGLTSLLVSIGSGDRSAPLGTDTTDRFYVLIDRHVKYPLPQDHSTISEESLAAVVMGKNDEGAVTLTNGITNQSILATSNKKGWYFQFLGAGEKVLSNSITNHGKVIFTTLVPDVYANVTSAISACNIPATQGRAYVLDVLEGKPVVDLNNSGGNPDNNDLFTIVSANEIPGGVQLVFNEPASSDGSACSEGDCVQNVDLRSGKKLSQIMTYNAGVLESVFWGKPQEKE